VLKPYDDVAKLEGFGQRNQVFLKVSEELLRFVRLRSS
jgi:hypothetical protein